MNKYKVTFEDEYSELRTVNVEAGGYELDNGFVTFYDARGNSILSVRSAIVSTVSKAN